MNLTVRHLVLLAVAVSMAGCADTPLLSGKKAPDELSVIEGPPLYLPPNFDVRPPSEMAARPHESTDTQAKAQEIITGAPTANTVPVEASDDWLVKKAGGDSRDATIRTRLEAEEKARQEVKKEKQDQGFFSRLFDRDENEDAKVDEAGRVILDENAPDADNYKKQ